MDKQWVGRPALSILANKEEDRFTEFLFHLLRSNRVLHIFLKTFFDLEVKDNQNLVAKTQGVKGGHLF